jgi:hypothetical protein
MYDQALFNAPGSGYRNAPFEPVKVLAHEIGHTLMLAHGNGLDDNSDELLPPAAGIRRFDEYCDFLGLTEDPNTFTSCEASSSLLVGNSCKNLRPLQREMARAVGKLVPGAVLPDPVADPAGHLVAAPGPCPPECTVPASLSLRKIEMADTPGADHQLYSPCSSCRRSTNRIRFTRISTTTRSPGAPSPSRTAGVSGSGITHARHGERHGRGRDCDADRLAVHGRRVDGGPGCRCPSDGSRRNWAVLGAEASGFGIISIQVPNSVRGPSGSHVRLQAVSEGDAQFDLLPANGAGGVVSLIPPDLPACSVVPAVAKPGQTVSITANLLPPSRMADIFVGNAKAGTASIAADGSLTMDVVIPATARAGVRPVEVVVQKGATSAACAILVQGDALTPATIASLSPEPNFSGWNNTSVNVALNATDVSGGPGIQNISYAATGAQPIAPTTQPGSSAAATDPAPREPDGRSVLRDQ